MRVDAPTGDRWELALDLLATGEGSVSVAGLILGRDVHGPAATGRLGIAIPCSTDPRFLTRTAAEREVASGMTVVAQASEDSRFTELLERFGADYAYTYEVGQGTVVLADVSPDGRIGWHPEWEPQGSE